LRLLSYTIYSFLGRTLHPRQYASTGLVASARDSLGGAAPAVREEIGSLLARWQSTCCPAVGRATQHSAH